MRKNDLIVFMTLLLIPLPSFSVEEHSLLSRHAGQQGREIKTLSGFDIEELSNKQIDPYRSLQARNGRETFGVRHPAAPVVLIHQQPH
jgi:hypothetical protein